MVVLSVVLFLLSTVFPHSTASSKYDAGSQQASPKLSDSDMLRFYTDKYAGAPVTHCAKPVPKAKTNTETNAGLHQIWLLPHTHDDVGWQYTIFGYFNNSVRHILDSVTADLGANPRHKFIWSEIKWLEMWWPLQNKTTRATFKRIVANGQFEFVGAGWSQHDEVTPSYRDQMQNTLTGHEYLRQILGDLDKACPAKGNGRCIRFGWQIDMFAGYSATTPTLWSNAGYDGMVIRFEGPNHMRAEWNQQQDYEYLWEGSNILDANKTRIATHVIRWNYGDMLLSNRSGPAYGYRGPALTFDFNDKKINTQKDIEKYATELVYWSVHRGSVYRGNRHLAVWGSDFQFTNAGLWFSQMDLLIDEINQNPQKYNATIQYTTLSTYFDHLHSLNESWPVKKGLDFEFAWPHTWSPVGVPLIGLTQNFSWQYQTGATSSRYSHKQHVRKSASFLRSAQAAYAQALATGAFDTQDGIQDGAQEMDFQTSWDTLGVVQHHDSMPGTMRTKDSVACIDNMPMNAMFDGISCTKEQDPNRHVLEDYTLRLAEADNNTNVILSSSLEAITTMKKGTLNKIFTNESNNVLVFNPSTSPRTEMIRMKFHRPVDIPGSTLPTVSLVQPGGTTTPLAAQIVVNDRLVSANTIHNVSPSRFVDELYFIAVDVKPYGTNHYTLTWDDKNSTTTVHPTIRHGIEGIGLLFNNDPNCLRVEFNSDDTLASFISIGCSGPDIIKVGYRQTYKQYLDGGGGAYCLIEQSPAVELSLPYQVSQTSGPVMQEVLHRYAYSSGLTQRTRIIQNDPTVHVIHDAGRLPSDRELVSSIATDIGNSQSDLPVLYTEASGAVELYPRIYNATSSIAQNYHAMVQTAVIRDATSSSSNDRQFSVLTRRTMGVASLKKGELEYMLMRRISASSDNQGPWPLDDKEPLEEEHMRLMINTMDISEQTRYVRAIEHEHPLETFYYASSTAGSGRNSGVASIGGLPTNVWSEIIVRKNAPLNQTYAMRLQNVVPQSNSVIEIASLSSVLAPWKIYGCVEMTLTMLQSRVENNRVRLVWNAESDDAKNEERMEPQHRNDVDSVVGCDHPIKLASLDVRTFVFDVHK